MRPHFDAQPMDRTAAKLSVTILTDMPLKSDYPLERDCGSCRKCIEICPVNAIKESHKDWNKIACLEKLKYFAKAHNVGQYICGLCVKACRP
ncbi:MAG: 4Fe-4S double cluster binding domain-containing protein [Nitrospirota bacterium]